jgi:hypothetical protein
MPYTKVVKVSDKVYAKLTELADSMGVTPNKVIEALLERVTLTGVTPSNTERVTLPNSEGVTPTRVTPTGVTPNSPNQEWGNPIEYVESRVTPSKKCVAKKVGKSYLVECEDGAKAYIPSNAIPDLVERFGLIVREKD